jgi:hypothetical protein
MLFPSLDQHFNLIPAKTGIDLTYHLNEDWKMLKFGQKTRQDLRHVL